MDKFTDCTKHDAQSAAKLYNLEYVHGTRDAEIHPGFFGTSLVCCSTDFQYHPKEKYSIIPIYYRNLYCILIPQYSIIIAIYNLRRKHI